MFLALITDERLFLFDLDITIYIAFYFVKMLFGVIVELAHWITTVKWCVARFVCRFPKNTNI